MSAVLSGLISFLPWVLFAAGTLSTETHPVDVIHTRSLASHNLGHKCNLSEAWSEWWRDKAWSTSNDLINLCKVILLELTQKNHGHSIYISIQFHTTTYYSDISYHLSSIIDSLISRIFYLHNSMYYTYHIVCQLYYCYWYYVGRKVIRMNEWESKCSYKFLRAPSHREHTFVWKSKWGYSLCIDHFQFCFPLR